MRERGVGRKASERLCAVGGGGGRPRPCRAAFHRAADGGFLPSRAPMGLSDPGSDIPIRPGGVALAGPSENVRPHVTSRRAFPYVDRRSITLAGPYENVRLHV